MKAIITRQTLVITQRAFIEAMIADESSFKIVKNGSSNNKIYKKKKKKKKRRNRNPRKEP